MLKGMIPARDIFLSHKIYIVFQKFVPIVSSLKFHWLLNIPFVKPSMLLIIHFNVELTKI